ncbi:MAG: ABC transporter ATP-binding protein/permease [Oscillospiraceae bacterium]|jgi:ATP-binding cassette subfamily B protein|nr:ABC transporter ATP-binding protein/permease [Oscillospiraceae bacterium]
MKKANQFKKTLANFGFLLKLYKKYALGLLIAGIIIPLVFSPITSLLNVFMNSTLLGKIADGSPLRTILYVAIMFTAAQLVINVVQNIFSLLFIQVKQQKLSFDIQREIYETSLATDYKYYDNPEFFGDYTWAVQNMPSQIQQVASVLQNLVQSASSFIAMTTYIVMVGPGVLVVSLVSLAINAVIMRKQNKLNYGLTEKVMPKIRRVQYFNRMFYTVDPQADLKATNLRIPFFSAFADSTKNYLDYVIDINKRFVGISLLQMLTSNAMNIANIALILISLGSGNMTDVAKYSALLAAASTMQGNLQNFISQFMSLDQITMYTDRIRRFFDHDSPIEASDGKGDTPADTPFTLDLDDVTFAYGEDGDNRKEVLSGLDLHIKAGEKVAIVGENGAGKSTMMKLLLRLYDVSGGEIRVDGKSIKDFDVRKYRGRIGMAFQDATVYSLTVRENLTMYREADDETLREALRKVGLTRLLEGEGLDAVMLREFDDNGVMLSGGETQKFALARLLVGGFGLIMLDEPTASLDPLAEYELNKLILDPARPETTIVVAHRLSTIRDADRIYLIDNGKVAEVGTHDELMSANAKYYEMFTKQAEGYADR